MKGYGSWGGDKHALSVRSVSDRDFFLFLFSLTNSKKTTERIPYSFIGEIIVGRSSNSR